MPTESLTPSSSPKRAPYVLMVAVALAVRLAVIPFLYHEWMDPFVLEHWAFGLIARSIASGHGFGSPLADTGLSALLPPVYSYLLAGIFKIFGIETKASVIAALSLNSLFSALTCVPVFLIAKRAFGDRVAKWAGWGWAFTTVRTGHGRRAWSRLNWRGCFYSHGVWKNRRGRATGWRLARSPVSQR